ncbi:MAG: protein kinase [Anaerolineae bacterium]|nr:protein kinase [Anaerolineae bacterium]
MTNDTLLKKHVTFCAQGENNITQHGRQAELDTVQFLVDNLDVNTVGDYRILANYNMPLKGRGSVGTLEIDLVLINKFGVFLLEVKNWQGMIEAHDDHWLQSKKYRHTNVFNSIAFKARVFKGNWFGKRSQSNELGRVGVVGLIILVKGKKYFSNHSQFDSRLVVGLDPGLINAVSSRKLLSDFSNNQLSDEDILAIKDTVFREHEQNKEEVIRDYRIIGKLSPGYSFEAFEAISINIQNLRVRLKRYQLDNIAGTSKKALDKFKHSAEAVSKMGYHPNIVHTINFFPHPNRPDTFYEVTEYIQGDRLDEIIAQNQTPFSLEQQLDYIEPLCNALDHSHKKQIYHRNLSPETIFVTQESVVKLADFDFAKILGQGTIVHPGLDFVNTPMTAPEIKLHPSAASPASDIYSLGVLWFFLASLPEKNPKLSIDKIDTFELPKAARDLMKKMVTQGIGSRPESVDEVLDQITKLRKS